MHIRTLTILSLFAVHGYAAEPLFDDVTSAAGITSSGVEQHVGGGLGWIDFDNDGWQDLYVPNYGTAAGDISRLFRNLGDANNDGVHDGFLDVTTVAGDVALPGKPSTGVAVADYNNDGFDDILVLNDGSVENVPSVNSLLKNNGDGTFTDDTVAAGLSGDISTSYNGAFGDVDGDGDLDLLVGNWGGNFEADYYINQLAETGSATFVKQPAFNADSSLISLFGTTMSDYDFDGDLDVVVANDFNTAAQQPSFFKNDGAGNFSVDPVMPSLEVYGMGVAVGDYDRNTRLDYYVTTIWSAGGSINELVSIDTDGTYSQVSAAAGVTGAEGDAAGNGLDVFWGTAFLDVDNDGNLDLYAAADYFNDPLLDQHVSNRLYMNNGETTGPVTFTEKGVQSNTAVGPGLGVARADYDHDGRVDIAVQGGKGLVNLLRNITDVSGNEWLQIRLVGGPVNNARAIGARVKVTSTSAGGTITQIQEVHAGTSHGSSHAFPVHFGFPAGSSIDQLTVEWPLGPAKTIANVSLNRMITIAETGTTSGSLQNDAPLTILQGSTDGTSCLSGSCAGFESSPGVIDWVALSPGTDGGIIIGKDQLSGSQNGGSVSSPGDITAAAILLFGQPGTFFTSPVPVLAPTDASLNIFANESCLGPACIGKTELGTWHMEWNTGTVVPFGSASWNCTTCPGVINWVVNPDNSYELDYSWSAPPGHPSNLGGLVLHLHLEGEIPGQFTDQAAISGINHVSNTITSAHIGGGVAWIDYNNDGFPDLYVPNANAGESSWFYHNNGDGTFTERAAAAGVQGTAFGSAGATAGDYDGDGCDDLFVANGFNDLTGAGAQRNTLYRNNFCDDGSLTFSDITISAGLGVEIEESIVASFGDLNADGNLDLYVGNYYPNGSYDDAISVGHCAPNNLYINNGDGTFSELSNTLGVANEGCTLAVSLTDYDGDGDLDIYVNSDFTGPNQFENLGNPDTFYRNLGPDGGGLPQFDTPVTNLTDAANGMGIAVGDYDNDLDLDYYATSMTFDCPPNSTSPHILNQNQGDGTFLEVAEAAGVNDCRLNPEGGALVGWGDVFFDADNDGFLDLYKANGSIGASGLLGADFNQPNRLYLNDTVGSFVEIAASAGVDGVCQAGACTQITDQSRGVAIADYDQDGDVDLFVVNFAADPATGAVPGEPRLYRNNADSNNHWLRVRLNGMNPNHRGIGARVTLATTNGVSNRSQMREINAGTGHGSSHDFPAHFGLGDHGQVTSLNIRWPLGCVQQVPAPAGIDTEVTVNEVDCDTDSDGMPDAWESLNGLDPNDPADATQDNDSDGLDNLGEYTNGTEPVNPDTDADGMPDGWEILYGLDPLVDDGALDPDNDGASNLEEYTAGTNPLIAPDGDLNGDGLVNAADVLIGNRIVQGYLAPTAEHMAHGDVAPLINGTPVPDGLFDTSDLLLVMRKALGLISY